MLLYKILAYGFVGFTALTQVGLLLLWLENRGDERSGRNKP
jgi:hypothetical protein